MNTGRFKICKVSSEPTLQNVLFKFDFAVGNVQARLGGVNVSDDTNVGWTAGAGVEFAVNNQWSLKAEYLYVDLGNFNCGIACGSIPNEVSFTSHIGRAGINYRF